MKKIVLAIAFICICSIIVYGESVQVSMRSSEKPGRVRLVFESEENVIKTARVFHSYSLVKIEFDSEFTFIPGHASRSIEISHKGASLFVTIGGLKKISVFRLSGPSRLVIDAEVERSVSDESKPEESDQISKLSNRAVVIDPGHGGYNIGLVGSDYKEKDIVLSISNSIRYAAQKAGANVFLTRSSDKYVSIDERIISTYTSSPNIFVSLHLSSSPDFVIYYAKMESDAHIENKYVLRYSQMSHVANSIRLARSVADVLKKKFKREVKVRQLYLPLLSAVSAPAIFLELPDGKYFDYNKANRYSIATAILKGIKDYESQ